MTHGSLINYLCCYVCTLINFLIIDILIIHDTLATFVLITAVCYLDCLGIVNNYRLNGALQACSATRRE